MPNTLAPLSASYISLTLSLPTVLHSLTPSLALAGLVTEVILITCQVKCMRTTHSFIKLITVSTVSTKWNCEKSVSQFSPTSLFPLPPPPATVTVTFTVACAMWRCNLLSSLAFWFPATGLFGFKFQPLCTPPSPSKAPLSDCVLHLDYLPFVYATSTCRGGKGRVVNNISIQIHSRIRSQSVFKVQRILHFVKFKFCTNPTQTGDARCSFSGLQT